MVDFSTEKRRKHEICRNGEGKREHAETNGREM